MKTMMLSQDFQVDPWTYWDTKKEAPEDPMAFYRDMKVAGVYASAATVGITGVSIYLGAKRSVTSAVIFGLLGLVLGGMGSGVIASSIVEARDRARRAV